LEYSEVTAWNWMTYFEPRIWQVTPKLIELGRLTALFWNVRGCQKSDVGGEPLSLQPHPNNRKKEFRGNREKDTWYYIYQRFGKIIASLKQENAIKIRFRE